MEIEISNVKAKNNADLPLNVRGSGLCDHIREIY